MPDEYGEFIGVDSLYATLVTSDTSSAYTAGTPEILAPVAEIAGSPKVSKKPTYYNNKPRAVYTTEAETEIKVVVSNVPAKTAAKYLGKHYDETTGRVLDTGEANPPDAALGFRFNMGAGGYRYYWFLKGTFSGGSEDAKSKEADVDVKTYELTFTAVTTEHEWTIDGENKTMKRVYGDTADSAFSATGWFSQVQTPDTTTAPSAIALSTIVPATGASSVSRSTTIVITFNNKIAADEVTIVTAAGALVEATKAYDTTGKILTITPSAQLAASTLHIVNVSGVVDIYGQELAAVTKTFTTTT